MLDLNTCLQDIVGLSENDCPCYGTDEPVLGGIDGGDVLAPLDPGPGDIIDRPEKWNTSLSGLYLDDQKYSIPLKFTGNTKDCGEGNVWDILARSRAHGLRNFITDLGAGIKAGYDSRLSKFSGVTAGTSHNYNLANLGAFAGVYIDPAQYRGAKGIIDEIELYMQAPGTFLVNVYSERDLGTPINEAPISVVVSGNFGRAILTTPLSLSFSDEYSRKVGYYVVYDRQGIDPRNLQFGCNCGNEKPWLNHFTLSGVSADSLDGLEDAGRNTQYPYGIRMKMRVTCGMDWLCRSWDFSNQWDRVASESIMLYGVCELLERQLNDPQPVASANPEMVQNKLTRAKQLLSDRMPWLATNIPLEDADCYACKTLYSVDEILI